MLPQGRGANEAAATLRLAGQSTQRALVACARSACGPALVPRRRGASLPPRDGLASFSVFWETQRDHKRLFSDTTLQLVAGRQAGSATAAYLKSSDVKITKQQEKRGSGSAAAGGVEEGAIVHCRNGFMPTRRYVSHWIS
jgi:hypothetical protein